MKQRDETINEEVFSKKIIPVLCFCISCPVSKKMFGTVVNILNCSKIPSRSRVIVQTDRWSILDIVQNLT